jgi:hypothetical protein
MGQPWDDMRKAKEEEYFKKRNEQALAGLKAKQPLKPAQPEANAKQSQGGRSWLRKMLDLLRPPK